MGRTITIEIKSKDEFWGRAFHIEWQDQFPDRKLIAKGANRFLAESEWMDDLERVAAQTFSSIIRAPDDPGRRFWMGSLIGRRGKD